MAPSAEDESTTVNGACNCGAIKISIPSASMPPYCGLCHCLNCRASSGSLFTVNLSIPIGEVSIQGTPKIYSDKDSASGNTVNRHFCGNCGTAIMSVVLENPNVAFVKGGPFTKLGVPIPPAAAHVWWKRREKWEKADEEIKYID